MLKRLGKFSQVSYPLNFLLVPKFRVSTLKPIKAVGRLVYTICLPNPFLANQTFTISSLRCQIL